MKNKMQYRLALDLGTTSLGWAMLRVKPNPEGRLEPFAVVKAGVRIFSDGRNPKDGSSLAVTRREARAMRRRRDRLLKRKARMLQQLTAFGFFPTDLAERKALETLNPYELRAKGLDEPLSPYEFGRSLFHINQRRGFKSNRKTDKKENDSSALKAAIRRVASEIDGNQARTVGEWLYKRMLNGQPVRGRYRETKVQKEDGKTKIDKSYDLYIDRAMVEAEFEALWAKQASLNPAVYSEQAKATLKDVLLFQRNLRPVKPGRCTLIPTEERAPLALPSTQRFRIYQEVNNLRILREGLKDEALTLVQRDALVTALEQNNKRTFAQIKKLLGLDGQTQFNFEDPKRQELKGNTTSAILSHPKHFGDAWFGFDEAKQDGIVCQLLNEENESALIRWLMDHTGVDEAHAEAIANAALPEGYGSLSRAALAKILPELRKAVITYDKAAQAAGFDHHSHISPSTTGEILPELPYYGEALQRHVGFGTGNPDDVPEKRYGKIANPTVHIGLNQVRKVVNALIKRYGHPSEVIVEVARDLKQSKKQRDEENKRQAENQKRNERIRQDIAAMRPDRSEERVTRTDIQKWILWEELSFDPANRCCPYSGVQISAEMLMSDAVEIEHILPFSRTLDDSLNNKTVSMRQANRIKGNQTPFEAFGKDNALGVNYSDILMRAQQMPKAKRKRFAENALEEWLQNEKNFLARALNDTRYLSRVAREYVSLICPQATRVIPGQMTAQLRAKFGLNDILGLDGEKNRNDHRHHAVDACVIGVTDQGLLQRFAYASASARANGLARLVDTMPDPWPSYRQHVQRAVQNIYVSHKPDHSHEGAMFDETIYSATGKSRSAAKDRTVIPFIAKNWSHPDDHNKQRPFKGLITDVSQRHQNKPYKGLLSNSNYCIEIYSDEAGWGGHVLKTFDAYQIVRAHKNASEGMQALRNKHSSQNGHPLVMRLMIGDYIRAEIDGFLLLLQVLKINSSGSITFIKPNETNISARYLAKLAAQKAQKEGKPFDDIALNDVFFQKAISADSLRLFKARPVTLSPIGELRDPGFKG
ncbi:type II CRISPR RNA-guided endonuclease Cas9 [Parvibium lacunae]|uniref:CRISPR-associated endonuclease Cas9 n=1 Tax=Parvibium lacunae TaxID=1888893 RepID=A0A368L4L2_9BURK|nr:type II CRISPR RNA-guided endonuclease Cas9 [Parvibium lacunae]RCS58514.1 type II CRISPR RNA-guided endonuclease Cas9 [Parvibium lacunae]